MNNPMPTPEQELPAETLATIDRMRSRSIPTDSLQRAMDHATSLDRAALTKVLPRRSTILLRRSLAGIAALLLIALSASLVMLTQKSAWAQVVDAVAQRPWMRLTLQKPKAELPEGEVFEELTMWFNGDRKIAALDMEARSFWEDLEKRDEYRFEQESGRIVVAKIDTDASVGIQQILSALSPFNSDLQQIAGQSLALSQPKATEVTVDGTACEKFSFQFKRSSDAASAEPMTVLVNKATKRPIQLTMRQAVFAVDYPDSGPNDIYALGVPKDVAVDDVRSLKSTFAIARSWLTMITKRLNCVS